jgi:curved DNA-binding protein CbpA
LGLSRRVHPDRFQAAGGLQLARAEARTGLLNKAHGILRDQRARVLWLLEDAALVEPEGDGAAGTGGVPGELLAEVFELREQLEEYSGSRDPAVLAGIEAARADFEGRLRQVGADYQAAARHWDAGGEAASDAEAAGGAGANGQVAAAAIAREAQSKEHFFRRLLGEIEAVLG